MKKLISILILACMLICALVSCGDEKKSTYENALALLEESEYEEAKAAFEKLGDSELVKFVYCEITVNDKVVCNRRLDMLTDGRSYTYTANTRLGQPLDVDIRYYMPESVSNEAQGASADIKLNITATNEKPIGE